MPSKSYDKYDNNVPGTYTTDIRYANGTSSHSEVPTDFGHRTRFSRTWTWVRTSSFAAKRRTNQLPTNPFVLEESRNYFADALSIYRFDDGTYSQVNQIKESSSIGWSNSIPDFSGSGAQASSSAVSALRSQIRDSQFSLPILIGEASKTAVHVSHTATRLYNSWRALRRGDFSHFLNGLGLTATSGRKRRFNVNYGRRPLEAASSAWLEYTYGWKPLLNDVYNGARTLARLHSLDYAREFTEYGRGKGKAVVIPPVNWTFNGSAETIHWLGVRYRFTGGRPSYATALGMLNPLEVAWELLPYSFVVDWFIPIGDYLSQLGSISDSHVFVKGYECNVNTVAGSYELDLRTSSVHSTYTSRKSAGWSYRYFTRSPLSGFPAPQMKPVKLPSSIGQALSAIALLTQSFKK